MGGAGNRGRGVAGLIHVDDGQVIKAECAKVSIDRSYAIRSASSALLQAFSERDPFVCAGIETLYGIDKQRCWSLERVAIWEMGNSTPSDR